VAKQLARSADLLCEFQRHLTTASEYNSISHELVDRLQSAAEEFKSSAHQIDAGKKGPKSRLPLVIHALNLLLIARDRPTLSRKKGEGPGGRSLFNFARRFIEIAEAPKSQKTSEATISRCISRSSGAGYFTAGDAERLLRALFDPKLWPVNLEASSQRSFLKFIDGQSSEAMKGYLTVVWNVSRYSTFQALSLTLDRGFELVDLAIHAIMRPGREQVPFQTIQDVVDFLVDHLAAYPASSDEQLSALAQQRMDSLPEADLKN
jgi:hypothetical protein